MQIYKITPQLLKDSRYFEESIVANMQNTYYWTDNWSEEFYIALAKKGFISVCQDTSEGFVLLPELQDSYAVLDFKNLHISNKVKKLLVKDDAELRFNTRFDEVLARIGMQHEQNWVKGKYIELLRKLFMYPPHNFKVVSTELISKNDEQLISGEVGYVIGTVYTSLSGFSSKEKAYANYGTLQLVLLAQHLEKNSFSFWNLGHPHMEYKQKLGCVNHSRQEFLQRFYVHGL